MDTLQFYSMLRTPWIQLRHAFYPLICFSRYSRRESYDLFDARHVICQKLQSKRPSYIAKSLRIVVIIIFIYLRSRGLTQASSAKSIILEEISRIRSLYVCIDYYADGL